MRSLRKKYKNKIKNEEEVTLLRNKLDEESIKTKFEKSSMTLDDISSSQRPSRDKNGLGYDNERNLKCSSFTNQEINNRSYAATLKNPIIKKESHKSAPSS